MTYLKTLSVSAAVLAMSAISATAQEGPTVEIRNFVGTIHWTNGPLAAEITGGQSAEIDRRNGLQIDGQYNPKRYKCRSRRDKITIRTEGRKYRPIKDYPTLTLSLPKDAELIIDDSILFAEKALDVAGLDLDMGHCSRVVLGDVAGLAQVDVSGASKLTLGDSARMRLEASGASALRLGDTGALTLDVSGASNIDMGNITGIAKIEASGASDLTVVSVTSENLSFDGSGASELRIDEGRIGGLKIRVSGASDTNIDADVTTADISASGASDVRIRSVSGGIDQSSSGASKVRIGSRD